jgi:hypothetical protein
MSDLLQEFCDSRGLALRVDRATGVVRGIKVLGLHSRNGREYLPNALGRAVALYEGAKVNVNHPKGHPLAPRDYQERIGIIRNVQHRSGDGLFADFHFNPKHYLAEQLAWDAEHAPENVGFSHNVQAQTSRRGETTLVEEIVQVHSVDLVADPATTRGLFESTEADAQAAVDGDPGSSLSLETSTTSLQQVCREQADEIGRLRSEVDQLRACEAVHERRERLLALLSEYHLPHPGAADPAAKAIVSDAFVESLLAAPDETAMRRLIEERTRLLGSVTQWASTHPRGKRPMSRDQSTIESNAVNDARTFVRAICR